MAWMLHAAAGWMGFGLLVALAFLAVGLPRVDPAGAGSSMLFRVLILPSCALLWPVIAWRWVRGAPS